MKNKKSIILLISILIVICIITAIITLIKKEESQDNQEIVIKLADTTVEQRKVWNDFLNSNPYLSQIKKIPYATETDFIKLAITSDNVERESIEIEEVEQNIILSTGDGYKKSVNNINEYIKNLLGEEEIAYNFVNTYFEKDKYLIIGEEYVYYTKIQIPEKIYIAMSFKTENNNYEVQIYEYDVTEENREELTKMLETGEINENTQTSSKYTLTGQIENNNIKILSKTSI